MYTGVMRATRLSRCWKRIVAWKL